MTKHKTLFTCLTLLLAFNTSTSWAGKCGHACPNKDSKKECKMHKGHGEGCTTCGHHGGEDDHGSYFLEFTKELELTPEQVKKLEALKADAEKNTEALKTATHAQHEELMKKSHEPKVTKKEIEKLAAKIGESKGKMIALKTLSLMEASKVLTEAQHKKMWEAHPVAKDGKEPVSCH